MIKKMSSGYFFIYAPNTPNENGRGDYELRFEQNVLVMLNSKVKKKFKKCPGRTKKNYINNTRLSGFF